MNKITGSPSNLSLELKNKNLKITPARISILELLKKSKKPLSVQEILKGLKKINLDLATVYRTMESLKKAGMVRRVDLEHGHAHYEIYSPIHHHHIICENCGTLADISNCNLVPLEKEILTSTGFAKIHNHSLEFFGLCKKCAKLTKN